MPAAVDTVSPGEIGHFVYCPRSWAVIATERLWADNYHTAVGNVAHDRVEGGDEDDGASLFRLALWSDKLGLYGMADRVDFGHSGPRPVEYKSARRVQPDHRAQLAAQALCLEAMFGQPVPEGSIWLTKVRRLVEVPITDADRATVLEVAAAIRSSRESPTLPPPVNDGRCRECSLNLHCLPGVVADRRRISNLHASLFMPPP